MFAAKGAGGCRCESVKVSGQRNGKESRYVSGLVPFLCLQLAEEILKLAVAGTGLDSGLRDGDSVVDAGLRNEKGDVAVNCFGTRRRDLGSELKCLLRFCWVIAMEQEVGLAGGHLWIRPQEVLIEPL